jgi:hypothetical protein
MLLLVICPSGRKGYEMAIEVIGKDESAKKKTTCRNCASVLVYTDADTQRETRTDYTGGSDIYKMLICPECKNKIYLG